MSTSNSSLITVSSVLAAFGPRACVQPAMFYNSEMTMLVETSDNQSMTGELKAEKAAWQGELAAEAQDQHFLK